MDYDAIIKELEAKVDALEQELAKLNKEREALRANLSETNSGISSLEAELDAANKRLNSLQSDHNKLSDDKESLKSQIESLEGKLAILQKEKSALEGDFAEVDQNLKETTVRLSDVSSRRKGLEDLFRRRIRHASRTEKDNSYETYDSCCGQHQIVVVVRRRTLGSICGLYSASFTNWAFSTS